MEKHHDVDKIRGTECGNLRFFFWFYVKSDIATRHILAKNQHSETLELSKLAVLEVLNRAWFHEKQNFFFNFSIVWNYNYLTPTTTLRIQSMGQLLHEIFSISLPLVVPHNFLHKTPFFTSNQVQRRWRRQQISRQNAEYLGVMLRNTCVFGLFCSVLCQITKEIFKLHKKLFKMVEIQKNLKTEICK